jgi:adenylylsulfate kinase
MKPASLFIGRWSPFHEGHQALIESVLSTGKPVVIAIRDTEPQLPKSVFYVRALGQNSGSAAELG